MINKLAVCFTDKLLLKNSISENERELYVYGFFMLLSHLMYFIFTCVFGSIFRCFLESVIFCITFQLIRRYAGGYHANTEIICNLFSILSIIACVSFIKLSKMYRINSVLLCIVLLCAILIFIFCPLDTPEKPLTDKEHKYFRKISLIILSLIIVSIIISFIFKFNIIFAPCCVSVILEGVLIGTGQIKKAYSKKRANSQV